jgi:predicted MPP superfamily phosphohydrolase
MITRRRLLRTTVAALIASPVLVGVYATQIEPRWVEMVRHTLPIRHLPSALVGATLVQISDLHIGPRFDWRMLLPALEEIRAMRPEFVVYTGDFVTYDDPTQFEQLAEFLPFAPLGIIGTAAILGNHDYGRGWAEPNVANRIGELVEARGIPVLRNTLLEIAGLTIAGVDDLWGTNYAPNEVLSQLSSDQPTLVLCHNPDVLDEPVWGNYRGWVLAGHTHGGQVKPPFLPPPLLPVQNPRYTAGIFPFEDGRTLYINRGLGHLWQVRLNVRPEVTLFRLEAAPEASPPTYRSMP